MRNDQGQTVSEQAELQALNGFTVWRSWDEPGGIRDELYDIARSNLQIIKLEVLGHTSRVASWSRSLTQGARDVLTAAPGCPVLVAPARARVDQRRGQPANAGLLISQWRANNKDIRRLLKNTELFVLVANPDGYQYTFDHERLWRKNLRDNNGDGQITVGDGVDPNRNFVDHWGYDNEGSSNEPFSETYRGPSPASEPETQAMQGLINRIHPVFMSNMHSFGQWLLYPQGWQTGTSDADNPVYVALAGTDADPAIADFNPASRHPVRDQR